MKKLILLFLLISGFANAQVLDQSSLSANPSFQTIDSGIVVSQSFTAGMNGQLSSISFDMEMLNCNTGMTNFLFGCWVYDSTGTNAIANQSGNIPVPYSRALYNIGFVNPAVLVTGTKYVIKIFANPQLCDTTTQSNAVLRWFHAGEDSTYLGGTASVDGSPMLYDFHFQTYVTAGCASPITANPFVVSGATCGNNDAELSVTPTGGFGPYSYSWSPAGGNTQSTGQILAPGMYTVTVSDTSGCTAQGSIFAYASNPIYATPNIGANISCSAPGSLYANPSGGNGGYTYLWSTAETTQTISGLTSPGYYTVTVTDNLGCTTTDSIYLPDMSMSVTINAYNATCGLNNGYIFATPSYANGPTYSWTGPAGYTSTNQNINSLTPGTYSLIVTDTVCPSFYDTLIISATPTYSYNTTINNNISCAGRSDGSATITVTGGNPLIMWSNVNIVSFNATGTNVNNLPLGLNLVTLNDSLGCFTQDSIFITEPTVLRDSLSFTSPSCGLNNGNISTNVTGGTAPYSYFWNTGNTANNLNGIVSGIYMVDVTDANGCLTTDVVTIGTSGGPVITPSVTNISCNNADNGTISVSIIGRNSSLYSILDRYGFFICCFK
jgi:hypothetical protein